jgi:hypothetical protein
VFEHVFSSNLNALANIAGYLAGDSALEVVRKLTNLAANFSFAL